ncbi:MAG: hypothetical protein ABJA77_00555 [Variovorax sp.]
MHLCRSGWAACGHNLTHLKKAIHIMKSNPAELALITSALAAIEKLLARARGDLPEVPFFGPTELGALPPHAQEAAQLKEEASYRARPRESAIHFCLTSAGALLDVSRTLLKLPENPSPHEQENQWKALSSHTKIAGRTAYRAALILADQKTGQ